MAKFRKKPGTTIEAEQWFEKDQCRNPAVMYNPDDGYYVKTTHGNKVTLTDGCWVIPEPDGNGHYPCKPDIFAAIYEAVGSSPSDPDYFCDQCPHARHLHNLDGSCPCGTNCAALRRPPETTA